MSSVPPLETRDHMRMYLGNEEKQVLDYVGKITEPKSKNNRTGTQDKRMSSLCVGSHCPCLHNVHKKVQTDLRINEAHPGAKFHFPS